ncbi:MAG: hypothetical protein FWC23_01290 [Chitinispirillia bacterium]|nr:hypothetical protein [Chitinispirillia bacterium]MCL2267811.1 hypothetical protein [Chitinispirillia bacterium]
MPKRGFVICAVLLAVAFASAQKPGLFASFIGYDGEAALFSSSVRDSLRSRGYFYPNGEIYRYAGGRLTKTDVYSPKNGEWVLVRDGVYVFAYQDTIAHTINFQFLRGGRELFFEQPIGKDNTHGYNVAMNDEDFFVIAKIRDEYTGNADDNVSMMLRIKYRAHAKIDTIMIDGYCQTLLEATNTHLYYVSYPYDKSHEDDNYEYGTVYRMDLSDGSIDVVVDDVWIMDNTTTIVPHLNLVFDDGTLVDYRENTKARSQRINDIVTVFFSYEHNAFISYGYSSDVGNWECFPLGPHGKMPSEFRSALCSGADISWYSGNADTFTINTGKELAGFAKLVNDNSERFKGKTIMLGRDITINDTADWRSWANNPPAHSWTPIGIEAHQFYGTFDGNGHTISGLYISSTDKGQGLFGFITNYGTITRLNITASYVKGANYTGILAGINYGVITECNTAGVVIGQDIAGGLVGLNCRLVSGCHASGSVTGDTEVGGLIGRIDLGSAAAGNSSSAAVSGDDIAGGLIGAALAGSVAGNFSTGKVTAKTNAGGFMGHMYNGIMRNNYYDMETSGQSDTGKGAGKTTAGMQSKKTVDSLNLIAGVLSANAWVHSDGKYPARSGKTANAVDAARYFASGRGTERHPYIINTKEYLENLAMLVNIGVSFEGRYIKLGQAIALNDTANWQNWPDEPPIYNWTPIGISPANSFGGTFDGGGYTVSGIYYISLIKSGVGLFAVTSNAATIKNLGVTASYIRGDGSVGGLVGFNRGRIINCYASVNAEGVNGVGGLVGYNPGGKIIGCYSTGTVKGRESIGGLIGCCTEDAIISDSYSRAAATGDTAIGGLTGSSYKETIMNNCYAAGKVTGKVETGGLAGWNGPKCKARNSFFDSTANGVNNKGIDGQYGRSTAQMKKKETYVGWDFRSIWGINRTVNNGYPYLTGKIDAAAIRAALEPVMENAGSPCPESAPCNKSSGRPKGK